MVVIWSVELWWEGGDSNPANVMRQKFTKRRDVFRITSYPSRIVPADRPFHVVSEETVKTTSGAVVFLHFPSHHLVLLAELPEKFCFHKRLFSFIM